MDTHRYPGGLCAVVGMDISTSYSYGVKTHKRRSIMNLEQVLMQQPDNLTPEEAEEEYITHHFAPHVYGREMLIPKGMCIVGKIHKHAHMNILAKGRVKVVTEFGDDFIEAPHMWTSKPGTKRALVALEDLVWITIHHDPNGDKDTDALERYIIADSFDAFDAHMRALEHLP